MRHIHDVPSMPKAGPYSHAVEHDATLYLSGQTPFDASTGGLVDGSIAAQTRQCLDNLAAVLIAAGLTLHDVVKCNVYLIDMGDFDEMNREYSQTFTSSPPARTTVAVAGLPLGARVEIDGIARRPLA